MVNVIEELRPWDPYVAEAGHSLRMGSSVWGWKPEGVECGGRG